MGGEKLYLYNKSAIFNLVCVRWNNGRLLPKAVHILIRRSCEYVSLHDKRGFAYVIKDPEIQDCPSVCLWPNVITRDFKREGKESELK